MIATGQRWMVKETVQAAKNEVGFDQHGNRWRRHHQTQARISH
ncbi:hypothetical protein [Streptomyces sp. NPDC048419]